MNFEQFWIYLVKQPFISAFYNALNVIIPFFEND